MNETNWWGVSPDINKQTTEPVYKTAGELEKVESIQEGDRIRARVAVMRGESELYFIKIPPNIDKLETRPASGVYEVVYHDIVYGYTNNPHVFGASSIPDTSDAPETYN